MPHFGLCGKTGPLIKTDCCNNWVCNDSHTYVMFTYAKNSCHRNHERYTLCGYHHNEGHNGRWQTCQKCMRDQDTEDYVYYSTNDFNFEKHPNPPSFEPTKCAYCKTVIRRGFDAYSMVPNKGYVCIGCQSF